MIKKIKQFLVFFGAIKIKNLLSKNHKLILKKIFDIKYKLINLDNVNSCQKLYDKNIYLKDIYSDDTILLNKFSDIVKKIINKKYINHEKIIPFAYLRSQLVDQRSIDMKNELIKQINFFKKKTKNKKEIFTFIEIGNFLGQSLEFLGTIIHDNFQDNYLIISIDPFKNFFDDTKFPKESKNNSRIIIGDSVKLDDNFLSEIYYYFINNISLTKFKNSHIHIRKNSNEASSLLKSFNIKADFIYIDANHSYSGIKKDYFDYEKFLRKEVDYFGRISGDDYELSFEETKLKFNLDSITLKKILNSYKERDFIYIDEKKPGCSLHPGITLFFNEINDDIIKYKSGFWIRNNIN